MANAGLAEQWFHTVAVPGPLGAQPGLTFIHLYEAGCRCNRFTEPHLTRLQEVFKGRGVRFMAATSGTVEDPAIPGLVALRADIRLLYATGIHSAPAALIFDGGGRLIYYGPYSRAAWCGSAGALVDPVLSRALSGPVQLKAAPAVRGCFCEW